MSAKLSEFWPRVGKTTQVNLFLQNSDVCVYEKERHTYSPVPVVTKAVFFPPTFSKDDNTQNSFWNTVISRLLMPLNNPYQKFY